ncbi:MAG: TVP38/TMEM64 family protein [bacterium]|nr:TVP38/TMEM64 family protein [bacterium]
MKAWARWILLGMLALGIAGAAWNREVLLAQPWAQWIASLGWAGPLVFIGIYALATLLFLPGLLLTMAGGALFGFGWGSFYNLAGATLGAGLSFLLARWLLADWVEAKLQGKLAQLKSGVDRQGWWFVAMVRLVPIFPFNLLNYALGLTGIGFWRYLLTSYVTMLPGAMVYTYLGVLGKDALSSQAGLAQWGPELLMALGSLALLIYVPKFFFFNQKSLTSS